MEAVAAAALEVLSDSRVSSWCPRCRGHQLDTGVDLERQGVVAPLGEPLVTLVERSAQPVALGLVGESPEIEEHVGIVE